MLSRHRDFGTEGFAGDSVLDRGGEDVALVGVGGTWDADEPGESLDDDDWGAYWL